MDWFRERRAAGTGGSKAAPRSGARAKGARKLRPQGG